MNADRSVITALVLAGITTVVRDLHEGDSPDVVRLVIGGMFAGIVLTLIAQPAPELARAIAWLILVGALFANGAALGAAITKTTKKSKVATRTPKQTASGSLGPVGPQGP